MPTDNAQAIYEILTLVLNAYPNQFKGEPDQKKETLKVYALALRDVAPDLLRASALNHISVCKWFPSIAELRESAAGLIMEAAGHPDSSTAWGEVAYQLRYVGSWGRPQFTDVLIQKAVEGVGGWKQLCSSENPTADRARFIQAYDSYLNRESRQLKMLPQVKGYIEGAARLMSGEDGKPQSALLISSLAEQMKVAGERPTAANGKQETP